MKALILTGALALTAACAGGPAPAASGSLDTAGDATVDAAKPGADLAADQAPGSDSAADSAAVPDQVGQSDTVGPSDASADSGGAKADSSAAADTAPGKDAAADSASDGGADIAAPAGCAVGAQVLAVAGAVSLRGVSALSDGAVVVGTRLSDPALANQGLIAKLDAAGTLQWQQDLGGPGPESLFAVAAQGNGSYAAVGHVKLPGQKWDGWVVQFSAAGQVLTQSQVGSVGNEELYGVTVLPDGLAAVGTADDAQGTPRLWAVRFAADGQVLWQKSFGTSELDVGFAVVALPGGDLAIAGEQAPGATEMAWLLRLSGAGQLIWSKAVHTAGTETGWGLALTAGATPALTTCGATLSGKGDQQAWLGRYDLDGKELWQADAGAADADQARAVVGLPDGAVVSAGRANGTNSVGQMGLWRTSSNGKAVWQAAVVPGAGLVGQAYAVAAGAAVGWAVGEVSDAKGPAGWVVRFDLANGATICAAP